MAMQHWAGRDRRKVLSEAGLLGMVRVAKDALEQATTTLSLATSTPMHKADCIGSSKWLKSAGRGGHFLALACSYRRSGVASSYGRWIPHRRWESGVGEISNGLSAKQQMHSAVPHPDTLEYDQGRHV